MIKLKTVVFGAGTDLGVHIDGANLGPVQLLNDIKPSLKSNILATITYVTEDNQWDYN